MPDMRRAVEINGGAMYVASRRPGETNLKRLFVPTAWFQGCDSEMIVMADLNNNNASPFHLSDLTYTPEKPSASLIPSTRAIPS